MIQEVRLWTGLIIAQSKWMIKIMKSISMDDRQLDLVVQYGFCSEAAVDLTLHITDRASRA